MPSAHVDSFARSNLPPAEQQPEFLFDLPELQFPAQLNCATELLDRHVREGRGDRVCIRAPGLTWTYRELQDKADRIAQVLVHEMGLVPGNRVLLRAPNNPMLAACWFAVMKAGGIAVATMPLLRAKELKAIVDIGHVTHALCDAALAEELQLTALACPGLLQIRHFNYEGPDSLERAMQRHPHPYANVDTAADDTCLIAFTSGTTGVPKGTMHFHRDVIAACRCWPPHVLRAHADDVFIGSPPLAFTFGLGGLVLFPMAVGASTVLLEKAGPPQLLDGIKEFGATILFTAPTSYRTLAARGVELRRTPLQFFGRRSPADFHPHDGRSHGIELSTALAPPNCCTSSSRRRGPCGCHRRAGARPRRGGGRGWPARARGHSGSIASRARPAAATWPTRAS
jgi:2-aminobenzoate-CoA ligase